MLYLIWLTILNRLVNSERKVIEFFASIANEFSRSACWTKTAAFQTVVVVNTSSARSFLRDEGQNLVEQKLVLSVILFSVKSQRALQKESRPWARWTLLVKLLDLGLISQVAMTCPWRQRLLAISAFYFILFMSMLPVYWISILEFGGGYMM